MNKLRNLMGLLLLAAICLVSCQKENFDLIETEEDKIIPELNYINDLTSRMLPAPSGEGILLGCFTLETPFEVVDEEGTMHTINGEEDLEDIEFILDFIYPIQITFEDGETKSIENGEDLGLAFAECLPDDGWGIGDFPAYVINFDNSCFSIKYPITVTKLDSSQVEIADEATFSALLAREDIVFFNFPLELYDEEQTLRTANSSEELFDLLVECGGWDEDYDDWDFGFNELGCYKIQFPITVILEDGTTVEVTDHEEYCELMLEGRILDFAYPLTLIGEDGEAFTVNSEEELSTAFEECEDFWDGGDVWEIEEGWEILFLYFGAEDSLGCYTINFPIEVLSYDENREETTITINNMNELERLVSSEALFFSKLLYPFSISWDGTDILVEDEETLKGILERCGLIWEDDGDDDNDLWEVHALYGGALECYAINFPIEVVTYKESIEENIVIVNNMDELERILRSEDFIFTTLVYPISINWDGTDISIDNPETLKGILERCEG